MDDNLFRKCSVPVSHSGVLFKPLGTENNTWEHVCKDPDIQNCFCQSYDSRGQGNCLVRRINRFWPNRVLFHQFRGKHHWLCPAQKSDVKLVIMSPLLMMWAMERTKGVITAQGGLKSTDRQTSPRNAWSDYEPRKTQHVAPTRVLRVLLTMNNKRWSLYLHWILIWNTATHIHLPHFQLSKTNNTSSDTLAAVPP